MFVDLSKLNLHKDAVYCETYEESLALIDAVCVQLPEFYKRMDYDVNEASGHNAVYGFYWYHKMGMTCLCHWDPSLGHKSWAEEEHGYHIVMFSELVQPIDDDTEYSFNLDISALLGISEVMSDV